MNDQYVKLSCPALGQGGGCICESAHDHNRLVAQMLRNEPCKVLQFQSAIAEEGD